MRLATTPLPRRRLHRFEVGCRPLTYVGTACKKLVEARVGQKGEDGAGNGCSAPHNMQACKGNG